MKAKEHSRQKGGKNEVKKVRENNAWGSLCPRIGVVMGGSEVAGLSGRTVLGR